MDVPCTTYTVHHSLHLHASNAVTFLELELDLPEEGFNYVQLIRSDGTPPTQAPPSNSGCPASVREARGHWPPYEVAV